MSIRAVFFDLGGVILRTEHQAPREHLAERLNLSYEDLVSLVFESPTAQKASLGEITALEHWEAVVRRLGRNPSEVGVIRDEFFAGDALDRALLNFIRSLRPARATGLITNGWLDARDYIARHGIGDAFDELVISAEVGLVKPDPRIYELALVRLAVQPGEAVLIDDMTANVDGARAKGMQGVLFRDTDQAQRDLGAILR